MQGLTHTVQTLLMKITFITVNLHALLTVIISHQTTTYWEFLESAKIISGLFIFAKEKSYVCGECLHWPCWYFSLCPSLTRIMILLSLACQRIFCLTWVQNYIRAQYSFQVQSLSFRRYYVFHLCIEKLATQKWLRPNLWTSEQPIWKGE